MNKKKSFLQNQTINRIDEFCGIKELTKFLRRFQFNKKPYEKLQIHTMIQYFESLYLYYVPLEDDLIDYRDSALDTVAFLNENKYLNDCQYLYFLSDLITSNLEHTKNIKRLA